LGGVASKLIAEFDRSRLQRAANLDFISNVLTHLKAVYDKVDQGRTLIKAHRSVQVYEEQMRSLVEARVKLRNVERALKFDERGTRLPEIQSNVHEMHEYLNDLIDEFETNYKAITDTPSKAKLFDLSSVATFVGTSDTSMHSSYRSGFEEPLDQASLKLRRAILAEFGVRSGAPTRGHGSSCEALTGAELTEAGVKSTNG
jgi:hypothetical protein